MAERRVDEIRRAGARHGNFTCGSQYDPLPLDEAVLSGSPQLVNALLDAGADPNARWSPTGDHFPLQEAIELRTHFGPLEHRSEIIRTLLKRGADPNARWCPFESRLDMPDVGIRGCRSEYGVTPLIMAAMLDEPETTYVLLNAGADPSLEIEERANALGYARSESVFYLLLSAVFPRSKARGADIVDYVTAHYATGYPPVPWNQTALASAIGGGYRGYFVPPPPPARNIRGDVVTTSSRVNPARGRVKALLAIGADPNERLSSWAVDWTPLSLAIAFADSEVVQALLLHGADPNARWCVPVDFSTKAVARDPLPGCTRERGVTPLMFAASNGELQSFAALLKYGAQPTLLDWQNRTALAYVTSPRREEFIAALNDVAASH